MDRLHFFSLLLALALLSCNGQPDTGQSSSESRLGEARLEVSGADAAQPFFHKGLLLLHSFEYEDARAEFISAQKEDPDFAMAYWGEAMTYNHSLWQRQNSDDGRAALEKLAPTAAERAAKAETDLEKGLLDAVEALYGEGSKLERDRAYAARMQAMYERFPGNHEVAAFYALSLLGAVPVGRDEEAYGKGARIAEGILKENPNHPGALHYLIHSYDDPGHAHLAKAAADSYSEVAPDAAHALHMPSHIYVALGMWDEVVASNIASYSASVKRMNEKGLDNDARSYHAFHWLLYGYLQQGRFEEAEQIMQEMVKYTEELPSKGARSYLLRMKGNFLVETGDWDHPLAGVEVDRSEINISMQAIGHFIEGHKAFRATDREKLNTIIDQMTAARQQAAMGVTNEGVPLCSAGSNYGSPNQLDIDQAHILELELRSFLATLDKEPKEAERLLQEAVKLQDAISYSYGPPEVVLPSYEAYGAWLYNNKRYQEALEMYERALERGPRRSLALRGKLEAARALENKEAIDEAETQLREIQAGASSSLKSSRNS